MSYCPLFKIGFPDFSWLCFHISEWKLIASFGMKSYRSTSTFVTVDPLFYELLPFKKNWFYCFRDFSFFRMKNYRLNLINKKHTQEKLHVRSNSSCSLLVGWLVVLMINVDLAIFQPYLDLEAGDNQSLKIQVARPGIEPRSSCSASQELNHSATAAPSCSLLKSAAK